MKRIVAMFFLTMCLLWLMCFTASAEAKAEEGTSQVLIYQPENLSYEGETITVNGAFVNTTSDTDMIQINSVTFSVFDANGKKILETTLNSSSLREVKLAPGERWNYTVIRKVSGFNADNYNISSGFQVGETHDVSISAHKSGCSFCGSRGNLTFSTEDTMSEEEFQNMLQAIKQALDEDTSPSGAGNTGIPGSYVPIPIPDMPSKTQKTCGSCGGTGYFICEKCGGLGYKEVRKRTSICLVLHHPDCPAWHSKDYRRCNDCHTRNDYYMSEQKCYICDGDGKTQCGTCYGKGTILSY